MMREYRLFFVKLPNGYMAREVFSINKPISELREKLCDYLGVGESKAGRGQYSINSPGLLFLSFFQTRLV